MSNFQCINDLSYKEKEAILKDIKYYKEIKNRYQKSAIDSTIDDTINYRGQNYGKFEGTAGAAQALKNAFRYQMRIREKYLDPDQQEALEMILHKIARIINGNPDYVDNWHDIAGYAKLVEDRLNGNAR